MKEKLISEDGITTYVFAPFAFDRKYWARYNHGHWVKLVINAEENGKYFCRKTFYYDNKLTESDTQLFFCHCCDEIVDFFGHDRFTKKLFDGANLDMANEIPKSCLDPKKIFRINTFSSEKNNLEKQERI